MRNKYALLMCVAFVALISAPMIKSFIKPAMSISTSEKRTLQAWPVFTEASSIQAYFSSINTYVSDHFGFRDDLIQLNNKLKFSLNESPHKNVIRGKNDWLFYKYRDPLTSHHDIPKDEIRERVSARANYINDTHQALDSAGIAYKHVTIPNKISLYSEHLPSLYSLTDIHATFDFFNNELAKHTKNINTNVIDVLKANKQNDFAYDLYFKNDTHWNHYGAYLVYKSLINELNRTHPNLELKTKNYQFVLNKKESGDLASFTGLGRSLSSLEPTTSFEKCTQHANISRVKDGVSLAKCGANDIKMLLIGDSFMAGIYPYLAPSVGSLYMSLQKTSRAELGKTFKELQPDVVVEILVERSLARTLP